MSDWTQEEIETIKAMWAANWSIQQIADRLGRTKGQVSGKIFRMKLPSHQPLTKVVKVKPPTHKPAPMRPEIKRPAGSASVRDTFEALGLTIYRARVPASAALPIPRGAIGPARTCQWTDSNRAPWLWCGAPSLNGYSWRAAHKRAVFPPREAA